MNKIHIATYGGGVDSTAMIMEIIKRGLPLDYVFFSNTGGHTSIGEKAATYAYVAMFRRWLKSKGGPQIQQLSYNPEGLFNEVWRLGTLPPIAFGFKTCSQKWKIEPVNRYIKKHLKGKHIVRYVAYDASESHRIKDYSSEFNDVVYPLVEFDWDRDDCKAKIKEYGLPIPQKSSCFFCPHMKLSEIKNLRTSEPCLFDKAIALEKRALSKLTQIEGLGRNKNWGEWVKQKVLFEDEDYSTMPCECAA